MDYIFKVLIVILVIIWLLGFIINIITMLATTAGEKQGVRKTIIDWITCLFWFMRFII